MNFYTLISKNKYNPLRWIRLLLVGLFLISTFIFSVNFIVDPYNITKYNLLNIKFKFARDDRTEKTNYFISLKPFDNIMIGSSRVYSINPAKVSEYLGGTTYNFGVGTATVEDHLGILLYLQKEKKLPKNVIIGVDFYTFNPDIPPNSYFLKNKTLNFLSYSSIEENYLEKFFSFDAFRASVKTLSNHFKNKDKRSRFDENGWASAYEDYESRNLENDLVAARKEIQKEIPLMYSNLDYKAIDPKRIEYYERIRTICKENNINLYIFTTPLHPELLSILQNDKTTSFALKEFIKYLNTFENFYNTYDDKEFYSEIRHFHGATHTSTNAGDVLMQKLLTK
ncbi:MAG: hypothetical protein RBR59_05925 [Sulfurimonadaceae bacterium]|jgi:hypothetical protein|nr:hypothetical protein [Sulfurimonadaceae bacterium]